MLNLMSDIYRVNELDEDDEEDFGEGYTLHCDNPSCGGAIMGRYYHMDTGDVFYCCPICGKEILEVDAYDYICGIDIYYD